MEGTPQSENSPPLATAAVIIAIILLIVYYAARRGESFNGGAPRQESFESCERSDEGKRRPEQFTEDLAAGYPYSYSVADGDLALNRFYSTAEVDPHITGQLYAGPRAGGAGRRQIYGARTSHAGRMGMAEYSSGVPGEPGVDVGLLGMREYSLTGKPDVFDDGIPENWRMPSAPFNWYVPAERDYYDVEGRVPRPLEKGLVSLREPDHEPQVGPSYWPSPGRAPSKGATSP